MRGFFQDGKIDYISPQLYSSGNESSNDYSTDGFDWSNFQDMVPGFVPSIVAGSYYKTQ